MLTAVLRRDGAGPGATYLDRSVRVALGVALAGAVAWAVAHDVTPCSVDVPQVCGADPTGAAAFGLLLAVPVLLWLAPVLACTALVFFAVLDVRFDDVVAAHGPFVALAVAAVLVALLHRRLVAAARTPQPAVPFTSTPTSLVASGDDLDRDGGFVVTLAAAAGLLVAVTAIAIGLTLLTADDAHRARSERVLAVVTGHETGEHDDDTVVDLRAAGGRTFQFSVLDFRPYPVGSSTAVAVDPTDPGWTELVAEEHDPTPWLAVAVAAAAIGLGAGARALEAGAAASRSRLLRARSPRRLRLQAGVVAAGSIVAGPAGIWWSDSWPERLTAGLGAANTAWLATSRWTRGLDADPARIVLHTGLWSRDLPWRSVRALHTFGATVTVADDRGDVHTFGPFDAGADGGALDRTSEIGADLAAWRADPPTTRRAERPVSRRLAPAGLVTVGVVAVECVTTVLATV